MNLEDKLKILSDAAKYDASCSSSGSKRENVKSGIGNAQVKSASICSIYNTFLKTMEIAIINYNRI